MTKKEIAEAEAADRLEQLERFTRLVKELRVFQQVYKLKREELAMDKIRKRNEKIDAFLCGRRLLANLEMEPMVEKIDIFEGWE